MAQKLLSISLGTTSAKLAEIKLAGKKVQVFSAYDIPLSEGLCDDGAILDVESLSDELKYYISRYKIKAKDIVFSIASKRIASKEVIIPFVKEKQIKGIVEINAPEYFPVANIENYAINYSILEIVKKEDNTQYRLTVTATPYELLEGYDLLAKEMKRKIEVIDYAGNAILQVLKTESEVGEVSAIIQLGYENTVINILSGGILIMQRNVANGLNALISAVCDSVKLDEEDAVAFLEDNDITRVASAYPDVKYIVDSIITSIGRIFDFYNGRFATDPITSVKFIGDATFVEGIGDALEQGLGLPTEEIFTLHNVQVKNKRFTPEFVTNFMANIGAVIRPMNLKYKAPLAEGESEKEEKLPWKLVILSVVASAVLAAGTLIPAKTVEKEKKSLEGQLSSLSSMQDIEMRLNEVNAKVSGIDALYGETEGPNNMLKQLLEDFEARMPSSMLIDSINVTDGIVTISAGGAGKESVAKLIMEMKDLPYVDDVKIDYISEVIDEVEFFDTFNMTFMLTNNSDTSEENVSSAEGEFVEDIENAGGEE